MISKYQISFSQTLSSFQSHLFFHSLSYGEYTARHGEPGVSVGHHTCHVCGHVVQQDPLHLATHLAAHGLSLAAYTDLHMSPASGEQDPQTEAAEAEVVSTVSSTSKSSPCLGDGVRKSVDNMSEASNSSALQDPDTKHTVAGGELLGQGEGSSEGDDEDSDTEELLHLAEPDIEIQEEEEDTLPNIHEADVEVNIIETVPGPEHHNILDTLRFFGQDSNGQAPSFFRHGGLGVPGVGVMNGAMNGAMTASMTGGMTGGMTGAMTGAVVGAGELFRSSDWADRCVYQCRVCRPPEVFDTHSKMSYHVKKRHQLAMKDYTAQFGRAMVHEEKHSCQICGSQVLWERSSIYQHIYQVHNKVSMEQYGKLMLDYKHDPAPAPSTKAAARPGGGGGVEANIDWTNECVFECQLCQPGRKFNSKEGSTLTLFKVTGNCQWCALV